MNFTRKRLINNIIYCNRRDVNELIFYGKNQKFVTEKCSYLNFSNKNIDKLSNGSRLNLLDLLKIS
jgi:hypothetical protein